MTDRGIMVTMPRPPRHAATAATLTAALALTGCGGTSTPTQTPGENDQAEVWTQPTDHGPMLCVWRTGRSGRAGLSCVPLGWDPTTTEPAP